jgi:ribosomal protein S18 acetylase RimI-like enzyme
MLVELTSSRINKLFKRLASLDEKEYFHPHKFDRETIKNLQNELGNHYYLYFDESDRFVGYGMLRTFNKYEIPTLGCVIWKEYRGMKHGKKIVSELIEKAKELGYKKIRLSVYPGNVVALHIYQSFGFHNIGTIGKQLFMEVDL